MSGRERSGRLGRRVGRFAFGDRTGFALWLALALVMATYWRVGFYVTDTHAIANSLVSLSKGHLAVTELRFPLDTLGAAHTQPGLHSYDGTLYGRNYGQVFAALPVLWVLQGLSELAAPRLLLAAAWSFGLSLFASQVGVLLNARRRASIAGSVGALAAFTAALAFSTPLDPRLLPVVALQMTTLAAAAGVGVLLYRTVGAFEGRRVGLAAGVAGGLAGPVGFWATLPKRHVLVAALVLAAVLSFAAARRHDDPRARALAYGFAALVAWVHALEGFFVVATLATVDVATARSNGRRELALVGLVLLVALAPTFATNVAIAGDPFQSPRLLPSAGGGAVEFAPDGSVEGSSGTTGIRTANGGVGGSAGDGATSGTASGDGTSVADLLGQITGLLPSPPAGAMVAIGFVLSVVTEGLAVLTEPGSLWHIFVRSGRIPGVSYGVNGQEAIELTVLESAPLLGSLLVLPVTVGSYLASSGRRTLARPRALTPARQTDLLVGTLGVVLTVVYLSRLPLHSQLTVRYVLPLFPLATYGVARLGPVSAAVRTAPRRLAGVYAVTTVGWLGVALAVTAAFDLALGEIVQLHALVDLAAVALLASALVGSTVVRNGVPETRLATTLGVAAGVTTAYVVGSGVAYFRYGTYALDLVRLLTTALPTL